MKIETISLIDQLRASRAISDRAVENIEELSDNDLRVLLANRASDGTVERVLGLASAGTVARVLGLASDGTVARGIGLASAGTVARINALSSLQVPVVSDLDKRIANAIGAGGEHLNMSNWHCGTTHCRAGWAITIAGEVGKKLEKAIGSEFAGRMIYEASTGRPAPDFFASTSDALEDIRRCAEITAP